MKTKPLNFQLFFLVILLGGGFFNQLNAQTSPDADLPTPVKDLRKEIRKMMIKDSTFDIAPYESAPVLPADTQMKDACFKSMPEQDKTVTRESNSDLQKESTLSTDINTVTGSVAENCMSSKSTPKFSPLDLNKWYLTSMVDPKDPNKYYRNSGKKGSLYRAEASEGGNRMKNASRLVRPDETMLNGCTTELMISNASGTVDIANPVWMRRELDNCLNQYILQQGRYPRINENYKASYFGVNAGLCQPMALQVPPSRFDQYEYAPSEYLGIAWKKLLVDSGYIKTPGARAEPNYRNHSRVNIEKKIEMPANNFGQILVEDLAENPKNGGEVNLQYEKITDPSHPFSPRWDYKMQDRSISPDVRCAEVPIDIMTFRQGPFEQAIHKKIAFNIACSASWFCSQYNGNCNMLPSRQCCSTNYRFKDLARGPFRKACGMPIVDACNFIGRPLTPINTLKMREVNSTNFQGGQTPEGYNFKDYFGINKPYMRCWDTNTECGETQQTFPIGGGIGALTGSLASLSPTEFSNIASSGLNAQTLQNFAQTGGLGNLQQLQALGLPSVPKIGDIAKIANIPNVGNFAKLASGGVNFNSLSSLASLPGLPGGLNVNSITQLTNLSKLGVPTNVLSQITAMPQGIVNNLQKTIQSVAGSPQALVNELQNQGLKITSGAASTIIGNYKQISSAISGGLQAGITGGISIGTIGNLNSLISNGINPSQIASSIIPNASQLSSAFAGMNPANLGQLSNVLSNPAALVNLSGLSNALPIGQLNSLGGLFNGPNALSPASINALTSASPADIASLNSGLGLDGAFGGGGTTKLLYNPSSTKGSNYAILGAGREGESCMIGGGKGLEGVANPDPITSWSELKLYYVRAMRMNVKCIANHEKLFKSYTGEGGLLRDIGYQLPIREADSKGNYSTYANVSMPFPWLGYLLDPKPNQRFPNFPNSNVSVQNLGTGLDGALPGDVLVFGQDLVRVGNSATDRNPYVGTVANADNAATRAANGGSTSGSLEFVKIRAYNHGKYVDACGNTDMLGDATVYTVFKTALPEQYTSMFAEVTKNVPTAYSCIDPALSACIEPLWSQIPRYKIEAAY